MAISVANFSVLIYNYFILKWGDAMVDKICAVARKAAEIILNADRNMQVDIKAGHGNFVTENDVKVQALIEKELGLLFPDAAFIGEEGDGNAVLCDGDCFIVDPIDGTCNFMYDYKVSAISIALLRDKKVVAGVIYQPYLDEMFYAERSKGAYLNGKPIHATNNTVDNALVSFGTSPYYPELCDKTFDICKQLMKTCSDLRRSGSAAADLAWIAAGRADLFFELQLSPWDFAAGSLICEEAGAVIAQPNGEPLDFSKKCGVAAGSKAAFDDFIEFLK